MDIQTLIKTCRLGFYFSDEEGVVETIHDCREDILFNAHVLDGQIIKCEDGIVEPHLEGVPEELLEQMLDTSDCDEAYVVKSGDGMISVFYL